MLTNPKDDGSGIRLIALRPVLREEAERILPVLNQRLQKSDKAEMVKVLTRHALIFGIGDRQPEEWRTLFEVYHDILQQFSLPILEEAFRRWNKCELYPKDPGRHAFFPKPAELFSLGEAYATEIRTAAWRAKKALEWAEAKAPVVISDEERALVKAGLQELARSLPAKAGMPMTPRPPRSPQEVAQRLREAAGADSIGDVV